MDFHYAMTFFSEVSKFKSYEKKNAVPKEVYFCASFQPDSTLVAAHLKELAFWATRI
jgi:hypothetical protein